jgi:hypothetical protein
MLEPFTASERRHAARRKVQGPGKIVTDQTPAGQDCEIRDLSDSGAKLTIDVNSGVPDEFYFLIPAQRRVARAKVVRRGSRLICIRYLEPLAEAQLHPNPVLRRIFPE